MTCGPRTQSSCCADWEVGAFIISDRDFGRGNWNAAGTIEVLQIDWIARHNGRCLGQAIGFDQRFARDGFPFFRNGLLQRGTARGGDAQARKIEPREIGIVDERLEQSVDAREASKLVPSQFLHEPPNITRIRDQHIRRPDLKGEQAAHRQGVNVEERQRGDNNVVAFPQHGVQLRVVLLEVGDDVPVCQDNPFRDACRAAGILQECYVFRPDRPRSPAKARALTQRRQKPHCARNTPLRHEPFYEFEGKIR